MNPTQKKRLAAQARSTERKRREEQAPRLLAVVPQLQALRIAIVEQVGAATSKHTWHVVIARAPALFVVSCGDKDCAQGGHDITDQVMHSLRHHQTTASGQNPCPGQVGSARCERRIQYEITAVYSSA